MSLKWTLVKKYPPLLNFVFFQRSLLFQVWGIELNSTFPASEDLPLFALDASRASSSGSSGESSTAEKERSDLPQNWNRAEKEVVYDTDVRRCVTAGSCEGRGVAAEEERRVFRYLRLRCRVEPWRDSWVFRL